MLVKEKNAENKQVCLPESSLPRVAVIGSGFAGINLIKKLKNKPVQIILIDENNYHQFQPLLYQVAIAGLEPDRVNFPIRKFFRKYKNLTYRYAKVKQVKPENGMLITDSGTIAYDYLVIATGTRVNYYGMEDVKRHSISLKNIQNSLNIRSIILKNLEKAAMSCDEKERESLTNFIIVGGGPTGVELCGALAEFKKYILEKDYPELAQHMMNIYLIEMAPRILPGMTSYASAKAKKDLEQLGVNVLVDAKVNSYNGEQAVINEEKVLSANTMIWAAGVEGVIPHGFGEECINRNNRLIVNHYNQVKNHTNIYAIGDIAAMVSDELPKGHPMIAPVAIQQGKLLGKNLLKSIRKQENFIPFEYRDKGMLATIGKTKAVAEIGKLRMSGLMAWVLWATVHLYFLVGFRNKLMTGLTWLYHYLTYDKANRHILKDIDEH